jgi:UDP-glucose 4-epimerase
VNKIIVTGGCGFIGSHIVDALVARGHDVHVIDDLSANNDQFYFNEGARYYQDSICNQDRMLEITKDSSFVFHLAAESRLQQAIENPRRAVEVNVLGTLNILECCKQNKIGGLVFSSTSSVYGMNKVPLIETMTEDCLNQYASTKYSAEMLIRNYVGLHGIKASILRYFNVFGERAPSKGQYALVTSIFLSQRYRGEPLTVVGSGEQKRDFIYVKDIAKANLRCMDIWNLEVGKKLHTGQAFNIGSSKETKVIDVAKAISDDIVFVPERKGEVDNNLSNSNKFREAANWYPTVDVIDWLRDQK